MHTTIINQTETTARPKTTLRWITGGSGPSPLRYPDVIPGYETVRAWAQPIAPGPGEVAIRVESGNALILSIWRIGPEKDNTDAEERRFRAANLSLSIAEGEQKLQALQALSEKCPLMEASRQNGVAYITRLLSRKRQQLKSLLQTADAQ